VERFFMVRFSSSRATIVALASGSFSLVSVARGATFADGFSNYVPGTYSGIYSAPASATGAPDPITGETFGFPNILSPFSPAYETNEIVGIGKGGSLTLSFSAPVLVTDASEVGVFTNFGLLDVGDATNSNPAGTFGQFREANVSVRAVGGGWVDLGPVRFDAPTNYFTNATSPYLTVAPTTPTFADFSKPFDNPLSSFNGLNWENTLVNLDGSAGGEWIDVPTNVGLTEFSFIRFEIPSAGFDGTGNTLFVDAVSVAASSVPEPTGLVLLAVGAGSLLLRRRRGIR